MSLPEPDLQISKQVVMSCFRWLLTDMLACLDFKNSKLMLSETFTLIIKKLLSFEKLVTQGEEIDNIVTVTLILMTYLSEA